MALSTISHPNLISREEIGNIIPPHHFNKTPIIFKKNARNIHFKERNMEKHIWFSTH